MKLLKDKYKLLEKIDEDEKVMLFLAQTVKEPIVNINIRTLKQRRLKNPDFVQRYTQEFQAMAALDSPLFLKIYDIDFFQDVFFVASEHLEGKSIQAILKERDKLSLAQIINIITQLTRAYGYALRENVRYRALTYSDIIYQTSGKIKITQFHIPRDVISNKEYDNKVSSVNTDIFFVGCLFYELLTHKQLFQAGGLSVRNVKVIKDFKLEAYNSKNLTPQQVESLKNIIFKCVTSEISSRYQSIDELLNALVSFVSDQINKTDVLTSMQVDPSKFMKTGGFNPQPDDKTRAPKNKTAETVHEFKVPAFNSFGENKPEANAAFNETNANNKPERDRPSDRSAADDNAAYDILFGRKNAGGTKSASFAANNDGAGAGSESGQTPADKNDANQGGKTHKGARGSGGEMWNNKKSSGGKGIIAKIAGFWYSMLFVISGFLSFLLYVFW
jgi:serine/threonine-protein kinase